MADEERGVTPGDDEDRPGDPSGAGRGVVTIPRLTSASAQRWLGALAVALLALLGYAFVAQPELRVAVLVAVPVLVLLALFLVRRRTELDAGAGEIVLHRFGVPSRRVGLSGARRVEVLGNGAGGVNLRVDPADGRPVNLPLLLLSDYVQRSQDALVLDLLADQVEQHAPQARNAVKALRAQSAHVASGGMPESSPLSALASRRMSNAAKAGGAAGGTSLLD